MDYSYIFSNYFLKITQSILNIYEMFNDIIFKNNIPSFLFILFNGIIRYIYIFNFLKNKP